MLLSGPPGGYEWYPALRKSIIEAVYLSIVRMRIFIGPLD
jgi:hypothetical protein